MMEQLLQNIKSNKRELAKQLGLFIIITFFVILGYGFVHETAHFIACKGLNLEANITINLLQNPPLYVTTCPKATQLNPSGLFIIRSAPYFLSMIIMLLLLLFFRPKQFYHFALPSGILLSDWLNILNLFKFFSNTIDYRNDFLQVAVLHYLKYDFLMSLFLGLTSMFYFWILLRYRGSIIKQNSKNSENQQNSNKEVK
jgi:hypothetical protein